MGILPLLLEAAWLAALWLCIPENRPWGSQSDSGRIPGRNIVWRTHQYFLLCGYVLYHFPVLFISWALNLVDFNRVSPVTLMILSAITAAWYTIAYLDPWGFGPH
jgi:hypothetical protein